METLVKRDAIPLSHRSKMVENSFYAATLQSRSFIKMTHFVYICLAKSLKSQLCLFRVRLRSVRWAGSAGTQQINWLPRNDNNRHCLVPSAGVCFVNTSIGPSVKLPTRCRHVIGCGEMRTVSYCELVGPAPAHHWLCQRSVTVCQLTLRKTR